MLLVLLLVNLNPQCHVVRLSHVLQIGLQLLFLLLAMFLISLWMHFQQHSYVFDAFLLHHRSSQENEPLQNARFQVHRQRRLL